MDLPPLGLPLRTCAAWAGQQESVTFAMHQQETYDPGLLRGKIDTILRAVPDIIGACTSGFSSPFGFAPSTRNVSPQNRSYPSARKSAITESATNQALRAIRSPSSVNSIVPKDL